MKMKHLTVDEIIGFVSAKKPDPEIEALVCKVNMHIMTCAECMRTVKAFRLVHDELERTGRQAYFKAVAKQQIAEKKTLHADRDLSSKKL